MTSRRYSAQRGVTNPIAALFAGITVFILSIFGGHQPVSHSASNTAAAAASTISTQPQQASTTAPTTDIAPTQQASSPTPTSSTPDLSQYVTKSELDTRLSGLSAFSTSLQQLIAAYPPQASAPAVYSFSGPSAPLSVEAFAPSQRIDHLANVTVSGVSGLTAADIPSLSYLPLSGGNITFASSTQFSVFNNAYFGATATSSFDSAGALALATPLLVSSGGTGVKTFGQGWIFSNGGTVALSASTSPTVNYITATSTTATSTFAGGAAFAISGGNVGIGTTSPFTTFAVTGNGYFSGNLNVGDASTTRNNLGLTYASTADVQNAGNQNSIAAWGDSLTAGNGGGGTSYESVLSNLSGYATYNGGVGGDTSTQIRTRMLADTAKYAWPTIIWAGRNNYSDPTTVEADIASMVAALQSVGNNNYIILSILNGEYGSTEYVGGSTYNQIISINTYLAATYGSHYLDARSYLVSLYNPSIPQDVIDHGHDIPPSSLRSDSVHLNASGYTDLGNYIYSNFNVLVSDKNNALTVQNIISILNPSSGFRQNGVTILTASTSGQNVFVGPNAGAAVSTGIWNTAIGSGALFTATSSGSNTAVGRWSLYSDTSGSANSALGVYSLNSNTTGSNNSALGYGALSLNTTASNNSALGYLALYADTTGMQNSALGANALAANNTGSYNAAFGYVALAANTNGYQNSGFGQAALNANISGVANSALGASSLTSNTVGSYNAAVGVYALNGNTASNNSAFGFGALRYATTGSANTAFGYQAGMGQTSNSNYNTISDTNMTFIGYETSRDPSIATTTSLTNGTAVGYLATVACSKCMVLGGTGSNAVNVGIGTTSPYALLSVSNSVSTAANTPLFVIASTTGGTATTTVLSVASTGNVTIVGSAATCTLGNGASATNCSSSDQRLKDNIATIDASSSLAAVEALRPVSFNWNPWMVGNGAATSTQFGFIAQEIMNTFPNLVTLDSNTHYYKLDYQGLFSPIVGAIQALAQKITDFADSFTTKELTFTQATGDEIDVRKLCIGSTCVTEDQLKTLLAGASSAAVSGVQAPSGGGSPSSATTTPDTPPVIKINGANPAHIKVGDSYADLGATVTGPQADLNLGIKTFLNGTLVSNIVVDTSAVATDTIDYVATDQAGNAATSTRTVIVEAPAFATPPQLPPVASTTTSSATSIAQ